MKKQCTYSADAHYHPEVQQMLEDATNCLNCGAILSYNQRKEGRRNRGYCLLTCYFSKPPKMAWVEKEYESPIKELVVKILNDGATVTATADRLGIGRAQFYQWMNKLDIKKKVVWV